MLKSLLPLVGMSLYSYGVFMSSLSAKTWLIFNYIVQGLGLLYAANCFMNRNRRCYSEAIILTLLAIGVIAGYKLNVPAQNSKWGFLDGATVAVWSVIFLRNQI